MLPPVTGQAQVRRAPWIHDRPARPAQPAHAAAPARSGASGAAAGPDPAAGRAAPPPKERFVDRLWSFRAVIAVALASVILGGLGGAALASAASDDGDVRGGPVAAVPPRRADASAGHAAVAERTGPRSRQTRRRDDAAPIARPPTPTPAKPTPTPLTDCPARSARARRGEWPGCAHPLPPDLPVSARRDDIAAAIRDHQVVIVAGETGSGKTTQLPKICLALGRGQPGRAAA